MGPSPIAVPSVGALGSVQVPGVLRKDRPALSPRSARLSRLRLIRDFGGCQGGVRGAGWVFGGVFRAEVHQPLQKGEICRIGAVVCATCCFVSRLPLQGALVAASVTAALRKYGLRAN